MNVSLKNRYRALFLFLGVWALYGCVTNLWNQYGYNLMHSGVEALVERGHFYLEGSATPKFASLGRASVEAGRDAHTDVFWRDGHLYPVKQPGMFFIGALVYEPLSLLGITYRREYNLATALVSWLTSGLFGALVVALLFFQALEEGLGLRSALIVALSLGVGSIFFPYTGVLHHDLLGASLLYFAYFLLLRPGVGGREKLWRLLLGGFCIGFAFTTSALAGLFLPAFFLTLLIARRWRPVFFSLVGCIVGILPLLFYDWVTMGNPFLLPNSVAMDTVPRAGVSVVEMWRKLLWYFVSVRWSLLTFAPVFYLAMVGVIMRAVRRTGDSVMLIGGPVLLVLYIISIPTYGGAMFGPRYLLPSLPFLAVGFITLFKWMTSTAEDSRGNFRRVVWVLFGILFCISVTICFTGALRGTMYGMAEHPFIHRLITGMGLSGSRGVPGAFPLLYPIIFVSSLFFYFIPSEVWGRIFCSGSGDSL